MPNQQKDNSTLRYKVALRKNALSFVSTPIVMETHGGNGVLYTRCYGDCNLGIVFERDEKKASILAMQRPTWAVYECDCVNALSEGVGGHLPCNFIDIDPYGDPWHVIDAFFTSTRTFPETLGIVVNDGLRQKLKLGSGWDVKSVQEKYQQRGRGLYENYLEVCKELVTEKAGQRGYSLSRWHGYYCGYLEQMTHYAAILTKP